MRVLIRAFNRLIVGGLAVWLTAGRWTIQAQAPTATNAAETLDAAMTQASSQHKPLMVLVAESGRSRADDTALHLIESSKTGQSPRGLASCVLDLGLSRNRAIAARFHPVQTPLLVCLSSRGVIISRDTKPLSKRLILEWADEAVQKGPELDAQLLALQQELQTSSNSVAALFALSDFLLARGNALEAIPPLAMLAHRETVDDGRRVQAWVALARAHLWIGEPEKARAEATSLIATLGPRLAEARAGGKLILGIHDANLNRPAQARREFEEAIAQAPDTAYAKEAAKMIEDLRKGWTAK